MRFILILLFSFLFNILFSQDVKFKISNKEINSFFKSISKNGETKVFLTFLSQSGKYLSFTHSCCEKYKAESTEIGKFERFYI